MLYPQENAKRELHSLNGFWDFQIDTEGIGLKKEWFKGLPEPEPMSVPASFNDLTQHTQLRDHNGSVWYFRSFFIPQHWQDQKVWIRFGAVHYRAKVWVNNHPVTEHEGGSLPFETEIMPYLKTGFPNTVAVRVDNVLDWNSIPPGCMETIQGTNEQTQVYNFDFFNYSGIHRDVCLYTTPYTFLMDIIIRTSLENNKASIAYNLTISGKPPALRRITVVNQKDEVVATKDEINDYGNIALDTFTLWEPDNPCLYQLKVELLDEKEDLVDQYIETFGIRTVQVKDGKLLLNDKSIYLKGCACHEDFHLSGRGQSLPRIQKDLNLLKWLGANSFRTSHYPYSEETLRLADKLGLLVIDEAPAVGMNGWGKYPVFCPERINETTLTKHCKMLREFYDRDKNHPCVVMWSVANEPDTAETNAAPYFERVFAAMHQLDSTRPVTMAFCTQVEKDGCGRFADVICLNRYFGWYSQSGRIDLVRDLLQSDLLAWKNKYNKPLMMTEFGADTIAGIHSIPSQMFSEEFQTDLLYAYCETFDKLDFVIGEHVWNLADFATPQGITRISGNRKGVFTRDRQPKMAAYYLKSRWDTQIIQK